MASAVVSEKAKIDRTYEHFEIRGLQSELIAWGKWIEDRIDYEGYPRSDNLMAFIHGAGGGTAGSRVLCLDMPTHVYATHGRVLRLPEHEQQAVWIWYVIRVKPDGTIWPLAHKCRTAGITEDALRQRVNRARRRILGLI